MPDYYKKMPSVKKRFPEPEVTEQYEQPIGPDRPTKMQRFESDHQIISGAAHRVKDAAVSGATWMQKRGREIQQEAPRSMPRAPMAGLPRDPFGTSRAGNPFRSGPMSGPFMDRAGPIHREAPEQPRRRKRRKARRYDDDEPSSPFSNPFHIPKSMRDMF
jgi:hypothetical protein